MQHLSSRSDPVGTGEAPSTSDYGYTGYSAAVGEFTGDGDQDVAVGMPRGNGLTGKVRGRGGGREGAVECTAYKYKISQFAFL